MEIRLARDEPEAGFFLAYISGTREKVYVRTVVELTEKDIKAAKVVRTHRGAAVGVKLTWSAARRLASLTDQHTGYRLAIIVDGRVVSAPLIKGKTGRLMIIAGSFTQDEAKALAAALDGRAVRQETTPVQPSPFPQR